MDLFRKCMDPVEKTLRDAKMDKVPHSYFCATKHGVNCVSVPSHHIFAAAVESSACTVVSFAAYNVLEATGVTCLDGLLHEGKK